MSQIGPPIREQRTRAAKHPTARRAASGLLAALALAIFLLQAPAHAAGAPAVPQPQQRAMQRAPQAIQQTDMNESTPIVDSPALRLHILQMGPANGYLIETEAGVTLVDAGLPTSTRRIQRTLARLERSNELCQIVITHAHIDHYGAAAELRDRTGAPILIHEADADAMAHGRTHLGSVRDWEWSRAMLNRVEWMTSIRDTPADQTLADGDRLTACGLDALDARVLHTPGHTPGSLTLLITDPTTGATYAFAGDLFSTAGGTPRIQSTYAHSWLQLAASVDKLRALAPTLTFPGHGSIAIDTATLDAMPLSDPILHALERKR